MDTPEYLAALTKRYFTSEQTVLLSADEYAFIQNAPAIEIAFIPNRSPYSYVNADGEIDGITKDIVSLLEQRTGFDLEYTIMPSGTTVPEYLAEHPDALIAGINTANPLFLQEDYLISDVFLSGDVALAGLDTTTYDMSIADSAYRLAIPRSYTALRSYIEAQYPQFELITCPSTEACADMVKRGEADFFAQNVNVVRSILQNPHYESIVILPTFFMSESMGFTASNTQTNRLIISILDKAIRTISDRETDQFTVNQTMNSRYRMTLSDFLYKFRYTVAVIAVLFSSLTASLIATILVKKRNYERLAAINGDLQRAIQKADSASAAKSIFLAQMSHELRTPMNAIIGLTAVAKTEAGQPDRVMDDLNKIESSSRLLLSIINDVLDMSAIEGGKMRIDSAPFNFKQLLINITSIFYQQARAKDVRFEVHLNGMTDEVLIGDELRLNQIMMNLLSNAVKFTPAGGEIDLTVLQASRSQDKALLRFSVSDTGAGMNEEMLGRLFRPFEQESAATAKKHGGSGLGLAITKNLVEMMGGSIRVESVIGKGSVFTIDIPFAMPEKHAAAEPSGFSGIRTLVVDDDEESRTYCGLLLERLGIRYSHVDSGEAALNALSEAADCADPYRLCLIDWRMPDMDGVEVTQKIRDVFGNEAIVIIVSAYDLNEVETSAKAAGANYFLPKPLFQSTLFNALLRISGGESARILPHQAHVKYDFTGKRVLLAEDVALNMEVAVKLLTMTGVQVVCAKDGAQAVALYKEFEPGYFDCVLMDINMPVMDGYAATKVIRASGRPDARILPIYAMTANAFSEDVAAALDAGMSGHIAKPIETEALYQSMKMAFDSKAKSDTEGK